MVQQVKRHGPAHTDSDAARWHMMRPPLWPTRRNENPNLGRAGQSQRGGSMIGSLEFREADVATDMGEMETQAVEKGRNPQSRQVGRPTASGMARYKLGESEQGLVRR